LGLLVVRQQRLSALETSRDHLATKEALQDTREASDSSHSDTTPEPATVVDTWARLYALHGEERRLPMPRYPDIRGGNKRWPS
ncbi:hypothetical protein MTO96_029140, partial [Rhipicephalus appendiculatus]